MGLLALLGLTGCRTETVIYSGAFDSEPYELLSVETKGFSTNSIHYIIKSERMKSLEINAVTTDWGPPYADDLYGNALRTYLTDKPIVYRNEPDNAVQHPSTMLYLSPKRFGRATFELYTRFMKSEWPKIDRQFGHQEYSNFPHIIGLVYGKQDDFARTFTAKREGKNYSITIEPDGRIRYSVDKNGPSEEYSGLSEKVQMPGKVIYVATGKDAGLPLSAFQAYKDKSGKTLGDYFALQ
ncbi:MAG: hypothetical protein LH609_07265 [Rudanella sp.]|nr:hypothetical protein [Rudanella sp.]